MHSGKVKLFCEVNEFIEDEETMALIIEYERILIDSTASGGGNFKKPSIKPIISYPEGSYFGDQDIFAMRHGYTSGNTGRDMTAVSRIASSIFILSYKNVDKI